MGKNFRIADVSELPATFRKQAIDKLATFHNNTLNTEFVSAGLAGQAYRTGLNKSEHEEQVDVFDRIDELCELDARYALAARRTFAIPNGGFRTAKIAGMLKAEGVKAGVSDIQCAMPSGGAHGLFVEMKSMSGQLQPNQREFIDESIRLGYVAVCCRGADEAFTVWKAYVEGTFE